MICVSRIAKKTAEVLRLSRWEQRCVFFLFLLVWPFSLPLMLGKKDKFIIILLCVCLCRAGSGIIFDVWVSHPHPTPPQKNNQKSNKQKYKSRPGAVWASRWPLNISKGAWVSVWFLCRSFENKMVNIYIYCVVLIETSRIMWLLVWKICSNLVSAHREQLINE